MKTLITFEIFDEKQKTTARDLADLNRLLPQVSRTPHVITNHELRAVLAHGFVFIARDANDPHKRIIAMATLASIYTLTKKRGDIHHVVVDAAYRGKGIGEKMLERLIVYARTIGIERLYLTSAPDRKTANKFYPKLGFKTYKTNHYRLDLS